jgi:uncharacterized membrane protein
VKLYVKPGGETISPGRLISFSDGVFAIAVTLLVFNLRVPEIQPTLVHQLLPGQIRIMMPHFVTYLISFLLVAIYWTIHHRILDLVTHIDGNFIWINLVYLLMISFIPFPSALIGTYPNEPFSIILYLGCIIVVGVLSMTMWRYASYNHRLISKDLPEYIVKYFFLRGFASLVIILVTLVLALLQVKWSKYCLFLLIPVNWSIRHFYKEPSKTKGHE